MDDSTVGQYLKSIRLQVGLTQVELAARLGVSNVSVNRWERDRVQPDAHMLDRYRQIERFGIAALAPISDHTNLPPSGGVIGRDAELRELSELLDQRQLVTVLGTGGAGKTSVATLLASRLTDRFADGVWFVDLSQLVDAASAGHACARVLGLSESGRKPVHERIAAHMSERNLLLILDNCEHVIEPCAEIAAAVLSTGGLSRLLTTSRSPLAIPGETVYQLPPITYQTAEDILTSKVRERRPNYTPDAVERKTIRKLCECLDQLPLAIELAAARMHMLSPVQILERLDRRFELLQAENGRSARQRTLAAAIGWSCDLLEPDEAALFRTLGLFSGWFNLQSVETLSQSPDAIRLLDKLVSQSMIVVDHTNPGGEPRYRLLDSLAAFARRWLDDQTNAAEIRRRHAIYYTDRISELAAGLHGANQALLLQQIDNEYEDAIVALQWCLNQGDPKLTISLTKALSAYWQRRGRHDEGVSWIERALEQVGAIRTPDAAALMTTQAILLLWLGRIPESRARLELSLPLAAETENKTEQARALDALGLLNRALGDLDGAAVLHQRAIEIARESGDVRIEAMGRINLGHVSNLRADHDSAERAYMDALVLLTGRGDLAAESAALANLGEVAGRMGKFQDALGYIERSSAMARQLGDPDRVAILACNEAEILVSLGNLSAAIAPAEEAVSRFRVTGNASYLAGALYQLGLVRSGLGQRVEGLELLREALLIYRNLDDWLDVAFTIELIADLFAATGDITRAARWLGGAEAIREASESEPYVLFDHAGLKARVSDALGERMDSIWNAGRELSADRLVVEVLNSGRVVDGTFPPPSSSGSSVELSSLLTGRQLEILTFAAEGKSNREIALELSISPRTVERHLTAVFTTLGVERRSSAIAIAVDAGLRSRQHS